MPGMPADIDLSIQYSDTETKRLDRDLQRIKQTAIEIQKKFDSIDLKKLQAQFKGLEAIALRAFGKGLQSAISAVTRRIGGQREAVKSLIRQYAILASVQARMAKPMITSASGKGVAQEQWMMGQAAGWHAEQKADKMLKGPSGYRELAGRPDSDKLISKGLRGYRELQREPFEKFQKTHDITETKTANQAASTKRYEDMMLRRAGLAKDILNTETSTANLAKKYGVSQSTILRDKKAIAQENMKALAAEKKGFAAQKYKKEYASYGKIQTDAPAGSLKKEPYRDVFKQMREGPVRPALPKTAEAYQSLGQISELKKVEAQSKTTSESVKKNLNKMWGVSEATTKQATKPLDAIHKSAQQKIKAYQDLGKISQPIKEFEGTIKSAQTRVKGLQGDLDGLIKKQRMAAKKKDEPAVDKYTKAINSNLEEQDRLKKSIAQQSRKNAAQTQKEATATDRLSNRTAISDKKRMEDSINRQKEFIKNQDEITKAAKESMQLRQGPEAKRDTSGEDAKKNADDIHRSSEKSKKAKLSEAQTFDNYAKRYEHAQGRVNAAMVKARRNVSLIPKTSKHYQAQADALGELQNLSRGLGSEKNQAAAFKTYQKDADRLFDTITKGAKQSKRHMGFMNKTFAKVSIIMSGMAATMFVWQQLSAAIGAIVRNFTSLEKALTTAQQKVNMSAAAIQGLENAARNAGKTGVTTADKYIEMSAIMQRYGMTATDSMEDLNKAVKRHEKILEKTLGLQISRFFNLMKESGYILFGSNADDMRDSLKGMNDQLQKTFESKNDVELGKNMFESAMKSADSIVKFFLINPIKWSVRVVLEPWADLIYDAARKIKDELDKIGTEFDKRARSLSYRGQLQDRKPKFEEPAGYLQASHSVDRLQASHESIDTTNAVNSMSYLDDAFEQNKTSAEYATKSMEDYQELVKQTPKDLEKAAKILGKFSPGTRRDRQEDIDKTLTNLGKPGVLSPEDFEKVEQILKVKVDTDELALRLPDYRKFYSTLRRYSDAYYDAELLRIKNTHDQRLARAQTPEDQKSSKQIAQKEFKILEKRKAASFVSSEKKLLETLGITSGTQIEVGIAFDEKTGKVTATKMMTYLDLLNYNTEQTVKAMNANFGKIGKTIPKNLGMQDFKSKGGPEITKYIKEAASANDLDPYLIEQVVQQESRFRPEIISGDMPSKKGALGPMQLMPKTAKELGVDPLNVKENIMGGADYLKQQLDRFGGDLKLALAAYNAGPDRIQEYGNQVPPFKETQNYVSQITQRYGSDQMRQPQPYGPRKPQQITKAPKPFEVYGPRMKQLAEGQQGVENQRQATRSQALKREGIFKNKQMLASFDQKIYKKAYDKLGLMTDKFYKNELAIINHFEEQNTDILGKSHAKKIADKARFNLDWQKKTADQLKVSQDALQMMEKSFQTTDIYSPVLAKRGKLKIEETKERLAKTKIPQKDQQVITKTMEITEYENINKARVNIDQQYFNQSKVMTDFLYQYKKDKIMKEIDLQILKSDGTLNAEQLLIDRLQALNDEYGQHRTQAWKTMYESTGKYSQQFAESEIKRLERLRDEMIRLTGDVAAANEMFKREKTKIDIVVNLKSEDAMAGMEALRLQMSLETETLAEAVNKNLKTIIDGTKEAFGETLYDTMQGNFENIWDLFESMGDRFKQMIDRMVSDYLASQLAQGLFGDLFEGGSGGGVAKDLIGAVLGGFSGSSSGPSPIVGSTGTTAMFMAKGGIIDEPTKFMKMASGGMINNRMTSGAIEIGEAGPEAVMPLKRSKSGKLGIETSAGITAPLKRLASGNLGIDASLFDGGSMKKMAKGGIITKPTMFYGGTNDSIKRLASGDIINEPIAPSLGPTISPTVDLPPTPESTISAATSTMQAVEPVTQTFDTPWHGNLSSGFESGTKLKSGGVAYQAATEAIGAANTDQAAQHRWAPLVQNVPFNEFEDMFLSAAKIKTKRIQDMGPDTYLSDMASKTKAQMNLEDPRYQFAKGGVINKPTIFTKLAKGGVISQNMVSVEQSMIQKDQSFKPPNTTGLGMGGIINKKTIFRDGDYLGKTIHMASGGVISSPFSSGGIEIGEAGPEVVMPLTKTSSGKLGVAAIGSGSSSQPNITNTFNINVTAPKGKIDQSSMNQLQTKLGISVQRSMRRNA